MKSINIKFNQMVLSVLIINEHNSIYFPNELFMVSNNELSTCAMRLGC